ECVRRAAHGCEGAQARRRAHGAELEGWCRPQGSGSRREGPASGLTRRVNESRMGRVRIAGTARASFAVRNQEVRIEAADGLHNDGGWSMKRWVEETFHANWRVGMEAEKILYEDKTEHQHIIVFENAAWGTVLIIDGVFQLTTLDEF